MIYTFKYIRITQEILDYVDDYIDKNNKNNGFLNRYPICSSNFSSFMVPPLIP